MDGGISRKTKRSSSIEGDEVLLNSKSVIQCNKHYLKTNSSYRK